MAELTNINKHKKYNTMKQEHNALKARRARLLERIQEAKDLSYEFPNDGNALDDLQDELEAVEAALGYPEPKEPSEANEEPPSGFSEQDGICTPHCLTCLCLLDHEDPMQRCRCTPIAASTKE